MKHIILTESRGDGEKLQNVVSQYSEFIGIQRFVKEDVISDPNGFENVEFIFSTWYMPSFSTSEISTFFPSLKAVFYAAGTVKYFAEPFLKNGVHVFSASKVNGIPVAEFVAAQVILANKGFFLSQRSYKSIFWKLNFLKSRHFAEVHTGNYNAKVGLIGFGAVGRNVARLLQPYSLEVVAYDPLVSDDVFEMLGVTRVGLPELFCQCDVISNHLPDLPSTKGMLNKDLFSKMKDSVTFINTGRGAQVIEGDLSKALRKRKNACALLDVTRHEPVFPWSPLLWNPKVFITPHIAGSLSNEIERLMEEMIVAYNNFISGKENDYEVDMLDFTHKA